MKSSSVLNLGGLKVRFMPATQFKEPTITNKWQEILERLIEQPKQMAEIHCRTMKEAKAAQASFHGSGTGRKLKTRGYRVDTAVVNRTVQVRLRLKNGRVPKATTRAKLLDTAA